MKQSIFMFVVVSLLVACGSNETLDLQQRHRDNFVTEVTGHWSTGCENGTSTDLDVQSDKVAVTYHTYYEPECESEHYVTAQTSSYRLVNNYKEGIANTFVIEPTDSISVTLNADYDVVQQNTSLVGIRNEKEAPLAPTAAPETNKSTQRKNASLREAKLVTDWFAGKPKVLNRLQAERLNATDALAGKAQPKYLPFGTRVVTEYALDNGALKLLGKVLFKR